MAVGPKIAVACIFFAVSFIGVWTPYFVPVKPLFLKFGLLFSSGLFIALGLLHVAEDSVEAFHEIYDGDYPVAWVVIALGFYMTWLADLLAEGIWKRQRAKALRQLRSSTPEPGSESQTNGKDVEASQLSSVSSRIPSLSCCRSTDALVNAAEKCSIPDCPCTDVSNCSCSSHREMDAPVVVTENASIGGALAAATESGHIIILDVIMLLLALTFHAFFEGLAVGLASDETSLVNLAVAIVLNEFFEGAALGMTLRAQNTKRHASKFLLYAIAASIVAPLGVVLGIILQSTLNETATLYVEGIGSGLAAGVFLLVATRHLIAKAMMPCREDEPLWMPFLKFGFSFLGLTVNCLTSLVED